MSQPTERDYQMAGDFADEGWLRDIDREETLVNLGRYLAAAREEGRQEQREETARNAEQLVRSTCADAIDKAREEGRQEERARCSAEKYAADLADDIADAIASGAEPVVAEGARRDDGSTDLRMGR